MHPATCTHLPGEDVRVHAPRPAARAGIGAPYYMPEKTVHVIDLKTQGEEDSACTREGLRTKM